MYDFLNGFFAGIYSFLNGLFSNLFGFLSNLGNNIVSGIEQFANFIGNTLNNLFEALKQVLYWLFQPIFDFLAAIVFFFSKLMVIFLYIIRIIARLFEIAKEIISEIIGTLTGFGYSGSTAYYNIPSAYGDSFSQVAGFFNQTGFNTIAYIMAVFVWILTAYTVVKIASRKD